MRLRSRRTLVWQLNRARDPASEDAQSLFQLVFALEIERSLRELGIFFAQFAEASRTRPPFFSPD